MKGMWPAGMIVAIFILAAALIYTYSTTWNGDGTSVLPNPPKLHLFLPITKVAVANPLRAPLFCKTLLGAIVNGYDPILYNWDIELEGKESHLSKVTGLVEQLRTHLQKAPLTDIVVMADALDVWFQLPPEDLIQRYREYGEPVIAGAESQCWPNLRGPECENAPASPLPHDLYAAALELDGDDDDGVFRAMYSKLPKHANAGLVVGTLGAMRPLFDKLAEITLDPLYRYNTSDQGAFNILLSRKELAVDTRLRLVWNSAWDPESLIHINHPYHPGGRDFGESNTTTTHIPWHLYPPLGRHLWTGETPVALHYNGPQSKVSMEEAWSEIWYGSNVRGFQDIVRQRLQGRTVRIARGGRLLPILAEDLCASHLPVFSRK